MEEPFLRLGDDRLVREEVPLRDVELLPVERAMIVSSLIIGSRFLQFAVNQSKSQSVRRIRGLGPLWLVTIRHCNHDAKP